MSSNGLAVSVRNLSKSYTISHNQQKHTTLAEAMIHRLRHPVQRPDRETFWALKDVSFDVEKGQVIGVIGRNGAGKSTLLKVLSRITEPTTGEIDVDGRMGSLLEVGTGFHPELTGRENVFLNGAILGMRRKEIEQQFDGIVEFAGVEQFIDTPVKRYSSGMYVRLAFAVAAYLNPEILIVDEVLAVGDVNFQKKCLGKMQEVASGGRTVLFVSHQMQAVSSLCTRGIFMERGKLKYYGDTQQAIAMYMSYKPDEITSAEEIRRPGSGELRFTRLDCDKSYYYSTEDIQMDLEIVPLEFNQPQYFISMEIVNAYGTPVLHLDSRLLNLEFSGLKPHCLRWKIGESRLAQGDYQVNAFVCSAAGVVDRYERAASFTIAPILPYPASRNDCVNNAMVYPPFSIEEISAEDTHNSMLVSSEIVEGALP